VEALFIFVFWAFIFWVCWKWFLGDIVNGFSATKTAKAQIAARQIPDEAYYEMAAKEVHSDNIRHGLWAKAWSDAGGDDTKAKALYLKLRVAAMKAEAANFIRGGMSSAEVVERGAPKAIVQCPHCKKSLRVDAGKQLKVTCPSCNSYFNAET
jgi:hypothetical protein